MSGLESSLTIVDREFLLPRKDRDEVSRLLAALSEYPADAPFAGERRELVRAAFAIDQTIRHLVVDEIASKQTARTVKVGTAFAFGIQADAAQTVAPQRRAWVFSTCLEQTVCMDGLRDSLKSRWEEVPGAVEAVSLLGLQEQTNALREVVARLPHWVFDAAPDKELDVRNAIDAAFPDDDPELMTAETLLQRTDWAQARLRLSLEHPECFFES